MNLLQLSLEIINRGFLLKRNGNDATYMTQYMIQKIHIGFHGYREKDIKMGRNYRDKIHIRTPFH